MTSKEEIHLSLLREHLQQRMLGAHKSHSHQWHMNRAMIRTHIACIRQLRAGMAATATVKDFISWPTPPFNPNG